MVNQIGQATLDAFILPNLGRFAILTNAVT